MSSVIIMNNGKAKIDGNSGITEKQAHILFSQNLAIVEITKLLKILCTNACGVLVVNAWLLCLHYSLALGFRSPINTDSLCDMCKTERDSKKICQNQYQENIEEFLRKAYEKDKDKYIKKWIVSWDYQDNPLFILLFQFYS